MLSFAGDTEAEGSWEGSRFDAHFPGLPGQVNSFVTPRQWLSLMKADLVKAAAWCHQGRGDRMGKGFSVWGQKLLG